MARPTSHADIPNYEQSRQWASFSTHEFIDYPDVVAAYAAFVRAAAKHGGRSKDGTVSKSLTTEQLDARLTEKQASWDRISKRYADVRLAADNFDMATLDPAWKDHEHYGLRSHAEAEGLPVFSLINADAAVREVANREQRAAVTGVEL